MVVSNDVPPATPSEAEILAVLQHSHDRLVEYAAPLTPEQLTGPSYPSEWTIAQVLSHLGSGAEIFTLFLAAGAEGQEPPAFDRFQAIWDVWNARSPQNQAAAALEADAAFLSAVEALTPEQRGAWHLPIFGAEQDLAGVLRMRLGEHAVHTWDVVVALDPSATLPDDAAALLIDGLDALVARSGKGAEEGLRVSITTTEPVRAFSLVVDPEGAALAPGDGDGDGPSLSLPAEAFIRLVYGRLDPDHTPPLQTDGVDIDLLRRTFPGF
ncbi:MAG: maleylpyruvate isomerase family mycothiol-dependent enzyme [Propionibacteriaceae bacterium]